MTDTELWQEEFSILKDYGLHEWNVNVIPWMKTRGKEYQKAALLKAKERGFLFDRSTMEFEQPWSMTATRGRNIIAVGWKDGILRCAFAAKEGARFYRYGDKEHRVPEAEKFKFVNSPFPDRLVATNLKGKYPVQREEKE